MSPTSVVLAPLLFGFALFLNSFLLFLVQPLIGRTILPHLGGNPLAWNTCLVFFQAVLLAGYVHAGVLHRFRGLRWQPCLQLVLIAGAVSLCFAGIFGERRLLDLAPRLDGLDTYPILGTLSLLIVVMGLPCLVLAAIGPLLQRWFAHLTHPRASDPYFLFVASNLGALTALVAYPLMIEPLSFLRGQWLSWKLALSALGVLLSLVAVFAWRSPRNPEFEPAPAPADPGAPPVAHLVGRGPATWPRRLFWLIASALPTGLMMATTDYLTRDVAPTPLLWALPVALYLIAFSQAFARTSPFTLGKRAVKVILHIFYGLGFFVFGIILFLLILSPNANPRDDGYSVIVTFVSLGYFALLFAMPSAWLKWAQPWFVLGVVFMQGNLFKYAYLSTGLVVLALSCYYLCARICLERLAEERPAAPHLNSYFNWIGLGGLGGGLFQLLIAPWIFRTDYFEFAFLACLTIALRPAWLQNGLLDYLACLIFLQRPDPKAAGPDPWRRRLAFAFDLGLAFAVALWGIAWFLVFRAKIPAPPFNPNLSPFLRDLLQLLTDFPLLVALFSAAVLLARPLRAGLALAILTAFVWIGQDGRQNDRVIARTRTALGIIRVSEREQTVIAQPGAQGPRTYTERTLLQGTTHQGSCITAPPELHRYPTAYYHRKGPVGEVMRHREYFSARPKLPLNAEQDFWLNRSRDNSKDDVRVVASLIGMAGNPLALPVEQMGVCWSEPPLAVIGMGTGTMLAYAHPTQWVDIYELDPAVIALSTGDQPIFHHCQAAAKRGVRVNFIPGDARRNLARGARHGFYQIMIVDAFNSDAIPIHLVTRQAIELYFQKLTPDGVILIHTSNRHVDLPPALEQIAGNLGVAFKLLETDRSGRFDAIPSCFLSEWVVLARDEKTLRRWIGPPAGDNNNRPAPPPVGNRSRFILTDEHASLISILKPNQGWPAVLIAILVMTLVFGIFLGVFEAVQAMSVGAKNAAKPKPP